MVKQEKKLFVCAECGMKYRNEEFAKKCENYCRENQACNLDIVKHSVELR